MITKIKEQINLYIRDTIKLYYIITTLCILVLFLHTYFTYGEYLNTFFFRDRLDTGMDFFNSIQYLKGKVPYTKYRTLYPALANLFFYVIYHCVPSTISGQWGETGRDIVAARGTPLDLRTNQVTMISFILFIIISTVIVLLIIDILFKNNSLNGKLLGIAIIFSYGNLCAIERGNIILIAFICLLIFTCFEDSNNCVIRESSLTFLAISFGLKLYPALFGIILLCKKQFKRAIRAILYGLIIFLLPFIIFEGIDGIKIFFNVLFSFVSSTDNGIVGIGVEGITKAFLWFYSSIFSLDYNGLISNAGTTILSIKTFLIGILFLYIILVKEDWKKYLAVATIIVIIRNSSSYELLFFIPGFIKFLKQNSIIKKENILFYIGFLSMILPVPIVGYINKEVLFSYHTFYLQLSMIFLVIVIITDYIKIIKNMNSKETIIKRRVQNE